MSLEEDLMDVMLEHNKVAKQVNDAAAKVSAAVVKGDRAVGVKWLRRLGELQAQLSRLVVKAKDLGDQLHMKTCPTCSAGQEHEKLPPLGNN